MRIVWKGGGGGELNNRVDLVLTDCPYHIVGGGCSNGEYGNKKTIGSGVLQKDKIEYEYKPDNKGVMRKFIKGTNHMAIGGMLDDSDSTTYAKQGKLFKHNDIKFSDRLPYVYKMLKDGCHCYIMINGRNLKELQQEAENAGFEYQQLLVRDKGNATPNRYYLNSCEFILMLRKGPARNINEMGTKNILKVANIIGNKKHPTEKPVELMEIMIRNSTNEGDLVYDPFMGAGATAIASKRLKRNFIGTEIDEKYYKIAIDRLENEDKNRQPTLFDI